VVPPAQHRPPWVSTASAMRRGRPTEQGGGLLGGQQPAWPSGVTAGESLKAHECEQDCPVRDLFDMIDQDADGVIMPKDFQRFRDGYCNRRDPTEGTLFRFVDRNGDGLIDPADFRQFFRTADLSRDGFITRSEFAHYEQVVAPIARGEQPHWDCPHSQLVDCSRKHGGCNANDEVLELISGILEGFRAAAAEEVEEESWEAAALPPTRVGGCSPAARVASQVALEVRHAARQHAPAHAEAWTWPAARSASPYDEQEDIIARSTEWASWCNDQSGRVGRTFGRFTDTE